MSFPTQATTNKTTDLKEQLAQIGLLALAECIEDFLARASQGPPLAAPDGRGDRPPGDDRGRQAAAWRGASTAPASAASSPSPTSTGTGPRRSNATSIERALTLDFVEDGRNLVLLGANGLGKTMIAKNLAYQAAVAGHSVLFVTAAELLDDLRSRGRPDHLPPQAHQVRLPTAPRHRRGRLPLLRPPRRRPALQGRRPPLREEVHRPHHQPRLPRLEHRLPQRHLHRHPPRQAHTPRRRHHDRRATATASTKARRRPRPGGRSK